MDEEKSEEKWLHSENGQTGMATVRSVGFMAIVERLVLGLPPARRMSPKVTACQQRACAGRNGDVGYLVDTFPRRPPEVDYRNTGMVRIYYASIMLC
jgi:hypothetical protein